MSIIKDFKYGGHAAHALLSNQYSWRITNEYLEACEEEGKDLVLDPVELNETVQLHQNIIGYMTLGVAIFVGVKIVKGVKKIVTARA